jgi:uncharacterized protein (TIGR02466 family)
VSTSDPFDPIPLFSYPLYSTVIAEQARYREPLIREILELKEKHPGVRRSNRDAWHSGEEFLALRSPSIGWVLQNAVRFGRLALAKTHQDWATSELKLGHYWANVLGAGGWNAPHHHVPSHWSGVYYVSVGQVGAGGTELGGHIEFLNPSPWQSHLGKVGNFAYGPRDGLLLLFPASLVHFVHPNHNEEQRISIAFNMSVVPKTGT